MSLLPDLAPSTGLQAVLVSSAPVWFDQDMQTMAAELMAREAAQSVVHVASGVQQELQALKRHASSPSAAKPHQNLAHQALKNSTL